MLSAGSAGTVGIYTDIFVPDLHVQILLDIRHDIAGYEGSLPLSCRIERGNTNQTMYAFF